MKAKLTKTQKAIFNQLSENTGSNICDSGNAYGRNFDKYKNAPNFNERLRFETDYAIIPVHVFMNNNLDRSDSAVTIEKMIVKELKRQKNDCPKLGYFNGDDIIEILKDFGGVETCYGGMKWENTYNYNNCDLSQTLQYMIFQMNGKNFAIVETHNGCDVRGGYSNGVVYEINDMDNFVSGFELRYEIEVDGSYDDYSIHNNKFELNDSNDGFIDVATGKNIACYFPC